jgi:hypothetical protein
MTRFYDSLKMPRYDQRFLNAITLPTWMRNRSSNFLSVLTVFAVFSVLPPVAFGQQDSSPVEAYPRNGAFVRADDERVTVWEVQREKGKPSPMYRLPLDQISVTLTEGAVNFTRPDGSYEMQQLRIGTVRFESKGTVVQDEGLSDIPSREIVFQLKDYVPPTPTPIVEGIPGRFPRLDATKLFENERISVWDQVWLPNQPVTMHLHYTDAYWVYIQEGYHRVRDWGQPPGPGRLRYVGYIGGVSEQTTTPIRDLKDIPPVVNSTPAEPMRVPHEEEVVSGNPRAIWIEFKYGK